MCMYACITQYTVHNKTLLDNSKVKILLNFHEYFKIKSYHNIS